MKIKTLLFLLPLLALSACNKVETKVTEFKYWNECDSLSALKEYVEDVTNSSSENFIPKEKRIATFDMDGTFYGELFCEYHGQAYLEYRMLEYRALEDETYTAPDSVREAGQAIKDFIENGTALPSGFDMIHARAAATAYAGMSLKEFDEYCKNYLSKPAWGFENMTYGEAFYQPMLEVFDYLEENDFTYYVVTGSDRFICRSLVCDALGIAPNRVIGMDVELKAKNQGDTAPLSYLYDPKNDDIIRTDNLLIKNLKMNKVKQIAQEIGIQPVLSFGNSGGDASMHNYALSNPDYRSAAFMLIADDDVRDYATPEKAIKLGEEWKEDGYHVISMKDDFKTIYKTDARKLH